MASPASEDNLRKVIRQERPETLCQIVDKHRWLENSIKSLLRSEATRCVPLTRITQETDGGLAVVCSLVHCRRANHELSGASGCGYLYIIIHTENSYMYLS